MKQKKILKNKILKYVFLNLFFVFLNLPVYAQEIKNHIRNIGNHVGYPEPSGGSGEIYFAEKLGFLIKKLLSFLAVIFLILIIYGGFLWMTARGNGDQVEKAKKIIINSVIGTIIVMLAYAITWFFLFYIGEATDFDTGL